VVGYLLGLFRQVKAVPPAQFEQTLHEPSGLGIQALSIQLPLQEHTMKLHWLK